MNPAQSSTFIPTDQPQLEKAVNHLRTLITIPSHSRDDSKTADCWEKWLKENGASPCRFHNNVYALGKMRPDLPLLMLNSHHDTVAPASSYTRDPLSPDIEDGKIYGLGSNDAGASGVALACTFLDLMNRDDLPVNLMLSITAAEEYMGEYGMRGFLPHLAESGLTPDMVIVGEPTGMQPAIAERGLLVFDCETKGVSGHAARDEGVNAIYLAIEDIARLRAFSPSEVSNVLGPIKVNVTMIESGTQHNVVPDRCRFVADVRTTDAYSNEETVELLRKCVRHTTMTPRSTRVHASVISDDHPLVRAALSLGLTPFVSPTTSDMALMHSIPSLKIGPGESSRSHSADEYVLISELSEALKLFPLLIENITLS